MYIFCSQQWSKCQTYYRCWTVLWKCWTGLCFIVTARQHSMLCRALH